jgi:DNA-binding CsgD family transcriptional regulator
MQEYKDKKYIFNIRKKIVKNFKAEGLTYYKIALIFNTTEYQVKKIINEI